MSPRAACRLEALGFQEVYDYMPGKVDWLARGLPRQGEKAEELRAGDLARRDVVACRLHEPVGDVRDRIAASPYGFALVTSEGGIVLGRLRRSAIATRPDVAVEELMEPGPSTVRAHLPAARLTERLRQRGLETVVVTSPDGELIGVMRREEAG